MEVFARAEGRAVVERGGRSGQSGPDERCRTFRAPQTEVIGDVVAQSGEQ
jgi:hypothetical protein